MGDSGRDRKARSERAGFSSQETLELPKGGTDAGARMGACAVEQALMFRRAAARLLGERPDPVRFGRFTIERRLGAGAMGVVYLARDPELDRAVAIKHLHPRLERGGALETAQRRMRREARAMARLSHANVVNIHEVGVHDGRLFLAMEYVDGVTLSSWTAGGERRWREVLNMFLQAGDGLRAAHQAGLVHRDFKPDNVLVNHEGVAKVSDFGLASAISWGVAPLGVGLSTIDDARGSLDESGALTRTDAVVGTPRYMSPEQFAGRAADARSDQFSYCVALYEALLGVRPYPGESIDSISDSVTNGRRRATPRGARAPRWIIETVERGLATAPEDRWPSMDELLAALRDDPSARRRRRRGGALLLGALLTGVSAWSYARFEHRARVAACEESGAAIEAVWSDGSRDALTRVILETELPYASVSAERVGESLDAYAERWRAARTQLCLAERVEGRVDASLARRGEWCLDARRVQLEALIDALGSGDEDVVTNGAAAAWRLTAVEPCVDPGWLSTVAALPGANHDELRRVRAALARVEARSDSAQFSEELVRVEQELARAEELGWAPLSASARIVVGRIKRTKGEFESAEATLEEAYFEAARGGATEERVVAAIELARVVGVDLGRHDEGVRWGQFAALDLESLASHAGYLRAELEHREAELEHRRGDALAAKQHEERALAEYERLFGDAHPRLREPLIELSRIHALLAQETADEAARVTGRAYAERALDLHLRYFGEDHPDTAVVLQELASWALERDDVEGARALYRRALAVAERVFGAESSRYAGALANLGHLESTRGSKDQAIAHYERALAIKERTLGLDNPSVGSTYGNLGVVYAKRGRLQDAVDAFERALAIEDKRFKQPHRLVANALHNLAAAHARMGHHDEARAHYGRALEIREALFGSTHIEVAVTQRNIGVCFLEQDAIEEAERWLRRSLMTYELVLGPEHEYLAGTLVELARIAERRGRIDEGVGFARRSLEARESDSARFVLARLTWASGEREAGRALAERARDGYREAGASGVDALAVVEAWLAGRAP